MSESLSEPIYRIEIECGEQELRNLIALSIFGYRKFQVMDVELGFEPVEPGDGSALGTMLVDFAELLGEMDHINSEDVVDRLDERDGEIIWSMDFERGVDL